MNIASPSALRKAVGSSHRITQHDILQGQVGARSQAAWELPLFAGRLGELSGGKASAILTLAFRLVLDAQRRDEPVAWITHPDRAFYPPDVAEAAVDVEALVVVWTAHALESSRAADPLLRSGGFGLIVLDLGAASRLSLAVLGRLAGLARKHQTAVLCLTESDREESSLGSLVSIRARTLRVHERDDRYQCQAQILKDKRQGRNWKHVEIARGPDGLY